MTTFPVTRYYVEVDFGRDATYGHARSDITSYVIELTWQWGMSEPFQTFAPPSSARIILDNSSGAFNVANTGSLFYGLMKKGTLARIRIEHTAAPGTPAQFFVGKIDNLQLDYGQQGRRQAVLTLSDPMLVLLDTEYAPPLLQNVTVDEAIQSMFDDAIYPYEYDSEFWILGDASYGVLGTSTTLFESRVLDLDTALTTLEFAGDQTASNIGSTAQAYLRELVAAEGLGLFFWDGPSGKFKFWNRDRKINVSGYQTLNYSHILDDPPPAYDHLSRLANDVTVNYTPRTQGTAGSTIYSMPNALRLTASETRSLTVRYRDPDNLAAACGAVNVLTPVGSIDYTANTKEDNSGTNITSYLSLTLNAGATSAELIISNGYHQTAYITALQVRGTPLLTYQSEAARAVDNTSRIANDRWTRIVDAAMLPADTAQELADTLVGRDGDPKPCLREIAVPLTGDTLSTVVDTDRVQPYLKVVNDSWSDNGGDRLYFVAGRRHHVPYSGRHDVTYVLEPVDDSSSFWLLGDSSYGVLGTSTRLYF